MRLLLLLLAGLLPLCVPKLRAEERGKTVEKGAAEAFGGDEILAIVRQADKVVAHRIESDRDTYRYTGEYKVVSGSVPLSEEDGRELIATMTDPRLYDWEMAKACLPTPGIRFQFHRGGDVVDMPICLECSIFMVNYKGKPVGGQHCDAAEAKLLGLALRLFPKDASLLELKESREYEEARRKKRAELQKVLDTLTSPADGARLATVEIHDDFSILESTSDGSIWLYKEGKGVHKPDPGDEGLNNTIAIIVKYHRERRRTEEAPAK